MRFILVAVLLLNWHNGLSSAQEPKATEPLKSAKEKWEVAKRDALSQYETTVKTLTIDYRDRLKAHQLEIMKTGDLDGALEIQKAIESADEGVSDDNTAFKSSKERLAKDKFINALTKIVWQPGKGGWNEKFQFSADGFVHMPPEKDLKTPWAVIDTGTVVAKNSYGVIDLFVLDLAKGSAKVYCIGTIERPTATWDAIKQK